MTFKKKKKTMKKKKKTKVHECAYFEYNCDDLGKYYFYHNLDIPGHECTVTGRGIYCQKGCSGYKKESYVVHGLSLIGRKKNSES